MMSETWVLGKKIKKKGGDKMGLHDQTENRVKIL